MLKYIVISLFSMLFSQYDYIINPSSVYYQENVGTSF